MTARELPPSEWHRLSATYLGVFRHVLTPHCRVLVVEDEDGQIIASWSLLPAYHAEGVEVKPGYERAGLPLMRLMRQTAESLGITHVVTASDTPTVDGILHKLGAQPISGQHYVLSISSLPAARPVRH